MHHKNGVSVIQYMFNFLYDYQRFCQLKKDGKRCNYADDNYLSVCGKNLHIVQGRMLQDQSDHSETKCSKDPNFHCFLLQIIMMTFFVILISIALILTM